MPRLIRHLSLVAFCVAGSLGSLTQVLEGAAAADPNAPGDAKPLPAAAVKILERLASQEDQITQAYHRQLATPRQQAIEELDRVLRDVTKTGDLDTALEVRKHIDELTAENALDAKTDLLGNRTAPDFGKLLAGTWNFQKTNGQTGVLTFTKDGAVTANLGFLNVPGHWQAKGTHIHIVWISDTTRWEDFVFISAHRIQGDSSDAGKGGFHADRAH